MNSPLQLERSFLDIVRVESVREFRRTAEQLALPGSVAVEVERDPSGEERWGIALTLRIRQLPDVPPPPYKVHLRIHGAFTWNEAEASLPEKDKERAVSVNGASVLYSSMREYLLLLTSRGPWGPISIPTVDFRRVKIKTKRPSLTEAQAKGRQRQIETESSLGKEVVDG